MAYLDNTGLAYFWGKIKAYVAALLAPKADDANVVHKTGDEVINGLKTFKSCIYSKPSSQQAGFALWPFDSYSGRANVLDSVVVFDNNYKRLFLARTYDKDTYGNRLTDFYVLTPSGTLSGTAKLSFGLLDVDGAALPVAAAPSTLEYEADGVTKRTNDTDIITRDWLARDGSVTDLVHISKDETISGKKSFTKTVNVCTTAVDRDTSVATGTTDFVVMTCKNYTTNNALFQLFYTRYRDSKSSTDIRCWNANGHWFDLRLYATDDNKCYLKCENKSSLSFEGAYFPIRAKVDDNNYSDIVQTLQSDNYNYRSTTIRCVNGSGFNELTLGCHNESNGAPGGISIRSTNGPVSVSVNGDFYPAYDNRSSLGLSNARWSNIYAATSSIGSSDRRIKSDVERLSDEVLDAWESVEWMQFRFSDAIAEKGAGARLHFGAVAQDIRDAFAASGLDASAYGFFCYDKWEATPELRAADGEILQEAAPAGDLYSLRYTEVLCMEAACQRRENARLKKRLADLEERLAALELKVS